MTFARCPLVAIFKRFFFLETKFLIRNDNLDYTIMQTINKWLEAIGMGRYAMYFIEQGFATPRQILLFDEKELERLGVGVHEHRKIIMKAIKNTRDQVCYLTYPVLLFYWSPCIVLSVNAMRLTFITKLYYFQRNEILVRDECSLNEPLSDNTLEEAGCDII